MAGLFEFLRDPQFQDEAAKAYSTNLIDPSRRFFGQALGGATAGVLGAPVDLATLLLNAAGAGLDPSQQFGGSSSIWRGLYGLGALPAQGNQPHEILAQMSGPALLNPKTVGVGLNAIAQGLRGIDIRRNANAIETAKSMAGNPSGILSRSNLQENTPAFRPAFKIGDRVIFALPGETTHGQVAVRAKQQGEKIDWLTPWAERSKEQKQLQTGFVLKNGTFLTRNEAYALAGISETTNIK